MNDSATDDPWWERLPYSGEFWGHERCPWNPFPRGSKWGDDIDWLYQHPRRKRIFRPRPRS